MIVYLVAAFAAHCASTIYASNVGRPNEIIDMGFAWLPIIPKGCGDWLAFSVSLALVYTLISLREWEILHRFLYQCATLMFIRSATVAATVLPSPTECEPDMFVLVHGGCYDKIFSGHTAYLTLASLYLWRRGLSAWLACGVVALEAIILVASREHYTVDVLIAIVLAVSVFRKN